MAVLRSTEQARREGRFGLAFEKNPQHDSSITGEQSLAALNDERRVGAGTGDRDINLINDQTSLMSHPHRL